MKYKTAIFDFDGTIMDTSLGIKECVVLTTSKLNMQIPKDANLNKLIGPPLKVAFMDVFGLGEKDSEALVEEYRLMYRKMGMLKCSLFDGILDVLKELNQKGIICAIASVKRQTAVYDTLEHFGITHYFNAVCGATSVLSVTDKIEIINDALKLTNTKKEEALMIGDSSYDSEGAAATGVDFCGVLWGFGYETKEQVKNSKYIIEHPKELRSIFKL